MPILVPGGTTKAPDAISPFKFDETSIILDRTPEEIQAVNDYSDLCGIRKKYMVNFSEAKFAPIISPNGTELYTYQATVSRIGSARGFSVSKTATSEAKARSLVYRQLIEDITGMKDGKVVYDANGKPTNKLCDPENPIIVYKGDAKRIKDLSKIARDMQINKGVLYTFIEYRNTEGDYLGTIYQVRHNGAITSATANVFKVPDKDSGTLIGRESWYARMIISQLMSVPDVDLKSTRKAIKSSTEYSAEEKSIRLANACKTLDLSRKRVINDLSHQYINIESTNSTEETVAAFLVNQKVADEKRALEDKARASIEYQQRAASSAIVPSASSAIMPSASSAIVPSASSAIVPAASSAIMPSAPKDAAPAKSAKKSKKGKKGKK